MKKLEVSKVWDRMIHLVEDYQGAKLTFHRLVDGLEEAIDTARDRDEEMVRAWYEFWAPLQEIDADSSYDIDVDPERVQPAVERMAQFLQEQKKLAVYYALRLGQANGLAQWNG
jgi:hypothetical protein